MVEDDEREGLKVNLSWSLSTQETMLNRWKVPTIASASKLRLTIPIKVGLP